MRRLGWAVLLLGLHGGTLAARDVPEPENIATDDGAQPVAQTAGGPTQDAAATPTRFSDLRFEVEPNRPTVVPTEHFAARSSFRDFAMSPDGVHLAIKRVFDGVADLVLINTATQQAVKQYGFGEEQQLDWFRWAGDRKLIISVSTVGVFYNVIARSNRLYVLDVVSGERWPLEVPRNLIWGGELIHVAEDGSFALVSVQQSYRSNPSVYRYELVPGAERERIVRPERTVWSWHADDAGVVRLGLGLRNNRLRIYYRERENDDFELVDKLRADDDRARFWNVVRIVSGTDEGYVLEENEQGRVGVRLFDYSTGEPIETFYENPDWDVYDLWLDSEGKPLAAFYTDDRDQVEWFDEDMDHLHRNLSRALGMEEVRIVSRSRDSETMLVWGGSESDPGALYIFSAADKRLDLLTNYRPELDFRQLARPIPVRYSARDGLIISAYLTLPRGREPQGLPLIILPHGGPLGIRDKLEYNDEVQLLANRGYAVLQPNYRGSGGYGEAFYEAGFGEVGRGMQDDIDDAMDWAVGEGIADPSRVCVVGGSYGGFAALWAVIRNPERYRCAASWAGVTDWDRMMSYDRRFLGRKRARDLREREEGEDADLDEYSPINRASDLNRPVLLAHGGKDRRVPASQYYTFEEASRSAPVRPVTLLIEDEGHGFSRAENEQKWYDALLAFLAEHNPAFVNSAEEPPTTGAGENEAAS